MAEEMQFDRAESTDGAEKTATCSTCHRPITERYYAANNRTFCPDCKARIEVELATNKGNLPRAILFGAGGAFAGAVLYFGVSAITGYEIGLIAIAVGWLVGRAMQKGSGGHGGRVFQVIAVLLTYLSISAAYFGMVIKEAVANPAFAAADSTRRDSLAAEESPGDTGIAEATPDSAASEGNSEKRSGSLWLGFLVLSLGLPIMSALGNMPSGLIGLFIVVIGLHQAWRMNQRTVVEFLGPFEVRSPAAPPG